MTEEQDNLVRSISDQVFKIILDLDQMAEFKSQDRVNQTRCFVTGVLMAVANFCHEQGYGLESSAHEKWMEECVTYCFERLRQNIKNATPELLARHTLGSTIN